MLRKQSTKFHCNGGISGDNIPIKRGNVQFASLVASQDIQISSYGDTSYIHLQITSNGVFNLLLSVPSREAVTVID